MGWKGAVAAIAIAATLGACSEAEPTHADDWPTSSSASSPAASSPTVSDTSAVCAKFREVAAGAFGESMSFAQIVDGLKEVGELGTTAANPSISTLAVQVGEEANARALISGSPNRALDALAYACNEACPL
jgi:hypothetical protein